MVFTRSYPLLTTDTTYDAINKISLELSEIYDKINKCRTLFIGTVAPNTSTDGALWLYPDTVNTNYILYVYDGGTWKILPLWTVGPVLPDIESVFDGHVHIQMLSNPICWVKQNDTWIENFYFNKQITPAEYSTPILDVSGNFDTTWISNFNPYDLSDFDENTPLQMAIGDRALYQDDTPTSGNRVIIPVEMQNDTEIYRFASYGCNFLHPDPDNPDLAKIHIGTGSESFGFGLLINGTTFRGGILTAAYCIDAPTYAKEFSSISAGITWEIMGLLAYPGNIPIRFYVERLC